MWIVLPVTAWILLFLLFNKNNCWRSSILLGALVWGVILTAITEFLNLFQSINFWSLLVDWGLINIILVVFYIKVNGKRWERFQFNHQIPLNLMVLLVGVAFIAATTGLIALGRAIHHSSQLRCLCQRQSISKLRLQDKGSLFDAITS